MGRFNIRDTACFTGHRPQKLGGFKPCKMHDDVRRKLRKAILLLHEEYGVRNYISGMAIGIDMWAAEEVLYCRDNLGVDISLICAIPCKKQWKKWPEESRRQWQAIKQAADASYYVTDEEYTNTCMQELNEWMVDRSRYVIAVWNGTKGGTGNCVDYAVDQGKATMVYIDPGKLSINDKIEIVPPY